MNRKTHSYIIDVPLRLNGCLVGSIVIQENASSFPWNTCPYWKCWEYGDVYEKEKETANGSTQHTAAHIFSSIYMAAKVRRSTIRELDKMYTRYVSRSILFLNKREHYIQSKTSFLRTVTLIYVSGRHR